MEVKEFNLDKAAFAIKKIANMKTIQQLEMVKTMKDMRAVLTDEQFKNMNKDVHEDAWEDTWKDVCEDTGKDRSEKNN